MALPFQPGHAVSQLPLRGLGLNFICKAFTTSRVEDAVVGVRGLGIRGCSVSMPFKGAVLELLDIVERSAAAIESGNTIVNNDGVLTASNIDYEGVADLIARHQLDPTVSVMVRAKSRRATRSRRSMATAP